MKNKKNNATNNSAESTVTELCGACGNEVELPIKLGIYKCPECGENIINCAMCDWDNVDCNSCELNKKLQELRKTPRPQCPHEPQGPYKVTL